MENGIASAADRDFALMNTPAPKMSDQIKSAALETGINPLKIFWDYHKLKKGVGGLRFDEYYRYGLHILENWKEGERERFLSTYMHWPLYDEISTRTWWAVTEDKWLSSLFLETANVPVPVTVGVIDTSKRLFPETLKLASSEALAEFFETKPTMPLFAKAQNSVGSFGTFVIEGGDSTHIFVKNENPMPYADFLHTFIAEASYILQEPIIPHDFFNGITLATATVRLINLTNDNGVFTPYAVLKLPTGDNIADNFWRTGNLACALDIETGEVQSIVSSEEASLVQHESLPGLERDFIGEIFPFWKEICALNEKVAMLHAEIAFSSTDIAITNDGPVVIEVNSGSAFELPQIANGKGFLTDEVRQFFIESGSTLIK